MITRAEKLLKQLGLDYEVLVEDEAFSIKPLDFLTEIRIVLVREDAEYSMFIWKNNIIQKECKFIEVSNITDVYSYLYKYDKNNLKNKKHGNIIR